MPEAIAVNDMFAGIARRYNFTNHLLSGGLDLCWRRQLVQEVEACHPKTVVDLATGSGEMAFAIQKSLKISARVTGVDFCLPMLEQAERKKKNRPEFKDVKFKTGDCLDLPLQNNSVDVLTIAFGLRNLEDRGRGLRAMHRVLRKPGGILFILEFSQPHRWLRPLYYSYLKRIMPRLAGFITGRFEAYSYLADSIESFPSPPELIEEIRASGFRRVTWRGLSFSTVAIHRAEV